MVGIWSNGPFIYVLASDVTGPSRTGGDEDGGALYAGSVSVEAPGVAIACVSGPAPQADPTEPLGYEVADSSGSWRLALWNL